ncbi:MAG TPA: SDR family oxidoreductase [Bacteroidales bacterium]|nr:SDR family oxidoreductase [Bacteroidales bacterium]HPS17399.1 SDR family oxidoreductase [Bacteroidales bacterium]
MLNEKVVIITGASSGIGKALAIECASKGAKVVIAARNIEKLSETEKIIKQKNGEVLSVKADVSHEEDCRNLINAAVQKYGDIHVLINNAGISMRAIFEELDLKVIKQLMDINFWGTVFCTKYALPYLLKNKGSVTGVSSVAGYKGLPGRTGYSASKFAMQGFLEVLRIETLKKGLHVLIACPGFTSSNIRNTALSKNGSMQGESPLNEDKLMTSEEVAKRIVKAIEKRKDRIVMTTQGKLVVTLNKFFPKLIDKMVYNHMAKEPDSPFK